MWEDLLPPVIEVGESKPPWSPRAYTSAGPVTVRRPDGSESVEPPKKGGDRSFVSEMPEGFSEGGERLTVLHGPGERSKSPFGGGD